MILHFVSTLNFGNWDFRTPDEGGIGGSETCHIEMAWRLARRGHEVRSYTAVPEESDGLEWRGTTWHSLEKADYTQPGLWVLFRSSEELDKFDPKREDQTIWLMLQDENVWGDRTPERAEKVDRVICLCNRHALHVAQGWPEVKDKIVRSSNGIKLDLIRKLEAEGMPERNPKRCVFSSSPDRGLLAAIDIVQRARERDPEIELHAFYGTGNIQKMIERPEYAGYKRFLKQLEEAVKLPGVHYHENVSQPELYRWIASSGVWLYPTHFNETSCITCMETQALGAIPITNPYWALEENVRNGIFIVGDPREDKLIQARYVETLLAVTKNPKAQEDMRPKTMWDARMRFNWERIVDQWDMWILEHEGVELPEFLRVNQYVFVHRHMKGDTINLGCGPDVGKLKDRGAVNVDVSKIDKDDGEVAVMNPVDVLADIRAPLPEELHGRFNTAIVAEVFEHYHDTNDITRTLLAAKQSLRNGGRIVITWPEDAREPQDQCVPEHENDVHNEWYAAGVSRFHRLLEKPEVLERLADAGLRVVHEQELDYTFAEGWGIVACQD